MTIRGSKFDGKLLKRTCHQIWEKLAGLFSMGAMITMMTDWPIRSFRTQGLYEPLHNNNLVSLLFELQWRLLKQIYSGSSFFDVPMRIKRCFIDWSLFIFCFSSVGKGGGGGERRGGAPRHWILFHQLFLAKRYVEPMFFTSFIPRCLPFWSYVGQYLVFWLFFYHFCSLKTAVQAQMSVFFSKCFRKCSPIPPTGTFIFRSFTVIILKFRIQDFTDPVLLKIRLTLTGLSLSVFKNQGVFAITTTKATKTLLKT